MREPEILYSILLVSVSGAIKLEFAYDFLRRKVPQHYLISFAMITYAAYSLDRGVKNKEDKELNHKFRCSLLISSVFCISASIFICQKLSLLSLFIISILYSRGVKGVRFKKGKGVKNIVVAFTWSLAIALFLDEFSLQTLVVLAFFFSKSFINTVLYDFKDVERDKLADICTLPVCMSAFRLRFALLCMNFFSHLLLILGFGLSHIAILSFTNGTFYIMRYCKAGKKPSDLLVDGEWVIYKFTEPFWLYFYSARTNPFQI